MSFAFRSGDYASGAIGSTSTIKEKNNKKKDYGGRASADTLCASIFVPKLHIAPKTENIFEAQREKKRKHAALKRFQDAAQRARNIGCL